MDTQEKTITSTYGQHVKVRLFGASHAEAVGVTVEGLPAGFPVDPETLQAFLSRRAAGRDALSSQRKEADVPEFLSGLKDGKTDGSPLTAVIRNTDARSSDYARIADTPRPGHADFTARVKYGSSLDMAGGGPFSGRMTAPLCVAGGIALQILEQQGVSIHAKVIRAGGVSGSEEAMREAVRAAAEEGDSVGGVVECTAEGMPAGLGGPMFEGLEGRIASAVYGIPAVKGVEFGSGFAGSDRKGSENNDAFEVRAGKVVTRTNHCGGILGGISTGGPIVFRVAFKPTPSIAKEQDTVNLRTMESAKISVRGRHDPCIAFRAAAAVEAAAALAILDAWLEKGERTEGPESLALCRREIDRLDARIAELFASRMETSARIASIKKAEGLNILDAERERERIEAVRAMLPGELKTYGEDLWRKLMELSRAYQRAKTEEDETC